MVNVSIALENIVLAASAQGLGTCWIGDFIEDEVKRLLEIPENFKIVSLLSVGYPCEKFRLPVRRRKSLREIVSSEKYGQAYTARAKRQSRHASSALPGIRARALVKGH